ARVGSHAAEVDTLQEQDVGDASHRAAPDDLKYAQLVSVVEHGSEIGAELHIGAADRSRDKRDRVLVQRLLCGDRTELENSLQAVADFGRIVFRLCSLGRRVAACHRHGKQCHSEQMSHRYLCADLEYWTYSVADRASASRRP